MVLTTYARGECEVRKKKGWILLAVTVLCCAFFAGYVYMVRQVEDHKAPEISFQSEELQISVAESGEALLDGVTAWDERDGDVTAGIIVEGISNISADQQATVTYAAFDQAGNVAKAQRILRYVDYESPRFTLSQPLVFNSGKYVDVMNYVGAEDAIDGALDEKIKATLVGGEGNISDVGIHEVEFRVTNSMGETIYLTVPVEVYQTGAYNASLELSENLVYVEKDAQFEEESYLRRMKAGSKEIALDDSLDDVSVQIKSDVDTRVPGTYSVEYTVKSGTFTGYTRLVVVVEESGYAG